MTASDHNPRKPTPIDPRSLRTRAPKRDRAPAAPRKPPLSILTTTLWEYPSQHYDSPRLNERERAARMQGDMAYVGATPSWIIWQLLQRYTREGDVVVDPMCGSGTTLDVCLDLNRTGRGFDISPHAGERLHRSDIERADARRLPMPANSADFAFVDPPYSTHIEYSAEPACIGKLDALGDDAGRAYYEAMHAVIRELHRVLKPGRFMALYVSDSYKKKRGSDHDDQRGGSGGRFAPIGFHLFSILADFFIPIDIIAVVRHNHKLEQGNWHKAAQEGNYFLRGFNYLFIMKKEPTTPQRPPRKR